MFKAELSLQKVMGLFGNFRSVSGESPTTQIGRRHYRKLKLSLITAVCGRGGLSSRSSLLNANGTAWSSFWFETAFSPSIILDDGLNTIEINQRGRELLSDNRGLFLRGATLSAKDRKAGLQLERFVIGLAPGEVNALTVLDFLILGRRLVEDGPVALQFRDLRRRAEIDCADLEPVFGVTPAEQRTLVLMLQGSSVTEIAAELKKSVLTVRTHVKRLYAKLGVQSREQMFARVGPFLYLARALLVAAGMPLIY